MAKITAFDLEGGCTLWVETSDPSSYPGEQRAGVPRWFRAEGGAGKPLLERVEPLIAALEAIQRQIAKIRPDDITLQAGVKFVGEAGVVLGKWGSEANIAITLRWSKPDEPFTASGDPPA